MNVETERQRTIARLVLDALAGHDFALAGFSAIREHGISDRMSQDIDLFTSEPDPAAFTVSLASAIAALESHHFTVEVQRREAQFARLLVGTDDGYQVEMDMAVDWRANQPALLGVGPVLSVEDAVASKVAALYGRGEARDFLDVDAIRQSGRFTDTQLLQLAIERDPGFDAGVFADQLSQVTRMGLGRFSEYGLTGDQLVAMSDRLTSWATTIREQEQTAETARLAGLSFPTPAQSALNTPALPSKSSASGRTNNLDDKGINRAR